MANIEILVVAGGGAAGGAKNSRSNGGDCGEVYYNSSFAILAGSFPVVIGDGGASNNFASGIGATPGDDTTISSITAVGGKSSATSAFPDGDFWGTGGTNLGAGGDSGGITSNAGLSYSISGSSVEYGKSLGSSALGASRDNGAANKGEGGMGAWNTGDVAGGDGGSGVVIISYATNGDDGISPDSTGGTKTTSGDQTIHTFTSDGTFVAVTTGSTSNFFQFF